MNKKRRNVIRTSQPVWPVETAPEFFEPEIVEPSKSPEITGRYVCTCGNTTRFRGRATVEIDQDFTVVSQATLRTPAIVDYNETDRDYDIPSYSTIECRKCGKVVWEEAQS